MIRIPIKAYSKAALDAIANPLLANQPEALVWTFWDYEALASTVTSQTYFTTVQANPQDGNLETAGQLPDPQYFQCWGLGFDIMAEIANVAAADQSAGLIRDVTRLGQGSNISGSGRGLIVLTISSKPYVKIPPSFTHASGGPVGFGVAGLATSNGVQWATNGIQDGGYYLGGAIVIPPKQAFNVQLTYSAAITLVTTTGTRMWLYGVLYRRVL